MMDNLQRAAILLLGMGQEQAQEVLRHMSPKHIEKLAASMNSLGQVDDSQINEALGRFLRVNADLDGAQKTPRRSPSGNTVAGEKSYEAVEAVTTVAQHSVLDLSHWQDSSKLIEFVQNEHPQVIAILVTCLSSEQAAHVILSLEESVRIDVIQRVACVGSISPFAARLLQEALDSQWQASHATEALPMGGMKKAASIMKYLDSETEAKAISAIELIDNTLCSQVQEKMFSFEVLEQLEDVALTQLLKVVPVSVLVLALKAADEDFSRRCLSQFSESQAQQVRDDLLALGPVQLSDALNAQKEVVLIAKRLFRSGIIQLERKLESVATTGDGVY